MEPTVPIYLYIYNIYIEMLHIIEVLKTELTSDRYSLHLTQKEVIFMNDLLIKHPEIFGKIQNTLDDIISDEKVDIHDIPKIVLLLSQIYHEHLIGHIVYEVGIINVLKFTLDALLESGIIPVPGFALAIVKGVIDVSLDLFNTVIHRPTVPPTDLLNNSLHHVVPPTDVTCTPESVKTHPPSSHHHQKCCCIM